MSSNNLPLSVMSSQGYIGTQVYAWIAIANNNLQQNVPIAQAGYWFVVIERSTLNVVYNAVQQAPDQVPAIGSYNTSDYILIVATLGIGLNNQPQGALFKFLKLNGGGSELARIEQLALQFGCGSLGTFGYALVSVLGNQNIPGFELSQIAGNSLGPILTIQLMPTVIGGKTSYTPVALEL
jgi:hypothetical protein